MFWVICGGGRGAVLEAILGPVVVDPPVEDTVSLNEQMITEGYAHAYDGGTKDMNLEKLREIRRSFGTLTE